LTKAPLCYNITELFMRATVTKIGNSTGVILQKGYDGTQERSG